jgi:hypothetical protein
MVKTLSAAALGVLAATSTANGDPFNEASYRAEPNLRSGIGVGAILGGGIAGFTDQTMRNTLSSNVAGAWDMRASIGTHTPLGVDLSYVGSAGSINTLTGASNGTLVGTTFEAVARINVLPHLQWNPYVFAGIGWQHYNVDNMMLATADSGVRSSDNVADFPMGAGISYRDVSGLIVDVRGTFRPATSSTLVLDQRSGTYADLHSWGATGAIGYEF